MEGRCHGKGFGSVQPAGGLLRAGRLGARAPPPLGGGDPAWPIKLQIWLAQGWPLHSAKS